ncbi:MAG: putative hydrolase of the metallo-beta-lactamase superfamily, partial [Acidimicrobiaceae bacterium]|nr:putative hydrolase of the metallo-beta-lactamase superfamily [Acidimicrobiaceae bacterium]
MADNVRIVFLGGLGEIGRNCAVIEHSGRLIVLDCGVMFPNPEMPGVDLVLPDFSYLRENASRVDGIVLTHGHEDHTGGLGFLLREVDAPVFGSALTLGLARSRVDDAGLGSRAKLVTVTDGERRKIGPFDVEFIPVTHSVPHGFATAFHTPQGVILHSGDFKLDMTPVDDRRTDLARIGALADGEGIRLLLADSTNAEEPGHTRSERSVGETLRQIFGEKRGRRIVVACFASHVHRIQQLADAAIANDRRIALLGRSMLRNIGLARELGLLTIPEAALIDVEKIDDYAPGDVCVISTGSQGEPMSALTLLASGENRHFSIREGDVVVLSSHAIPGNEWAVGKVMDGLARRGAEVIHSGIAHVHESGHAKQGELATLHAVARPKCFIPVHGEYRHLLRHARLAIEMGIDEHEVLLCEDGDAVLLSDEGIDFDGEVPAGYLYVDGVVGDIGSGVLRDRRALAEEGVVVVVLAIDSHSGDVITGPEIITRGWVHAPEAEELIEDARSAVLKAVGEAVGAGSFDSDTIRRATRRAVGKIVSDRTKRRPMIVPVV